MVINWILRTYKANWGQSGMTEEGTGTDVGQSGVVVAKRRIPNEAMKSEMERGDGLWDLVGFIWREGSLHIYTVKSMGWHERTVWLFCSFSVATSKSYCPDQIVNIPTCQAKELLTFTQLRTAQLQKSRRQERGQICSGSTSQADVFMKPDWKVAAEVFLQGFLPQCFLKTRYT